MRTRRTESGTVRWQSGGGRPFPGCSEFAKSLMKHLGWVAERFKAPVLKTGVGASLPWVRIPPHPFPPTCGPSRTEIIIK
jgi:hypothetical protein